MPTVYDVTLTFLTDILGTVPLNKEIYVDFIASKPDAPPKAVEEADTIALEEKGKTGFHRMPDGTPALYDYVWKGYLKDASSMMNRVDGSLSKKMKAYRKIIDGLIFVEPRLMPFAMSGPVGELQRPLRAQTAQGERVALAFSETVPAGSTITFEMIILEDKVVTEEWLREVMQYGKYRGLGQWRSASWGRFDFAMESK